MQITLTITDPAALAAERTALDATTLQAEAEVVKAQLLKCGRYWTSNRLVADAYVAAGYHARTHANGAQYLITITA